MKDGSDRADLRYHRPRCALTGHTGDGVRQKVSWLSSGLSACSRRDGNTERMVAAVVFPFLPA